MPIASAKKISTLTSKTTMVAKEKSPLLKIKVKNITPIISSTTPAPKIAVPTLVFSFFISIKDSTVMLTDVAVITAPKNRFKELSSA